MDPQRFQRAAELFLRARSLGLSERDEYLARECGADHTLRESVEGLLAGAEQQLPFAELAAELGGALAPLGADGAPAPDSSIGPYRLLEKLGEGGFGVVYMAEQTEPVRRKVALKIVRQGLDTKRVIARFEAERQALAMMGHPNITRVLDAGATQHGRPYFVMELIRGQPITTFCDMEQLDARARLALMIPVCQAVQHAHLKGIIHRDLKPSNVLVTMTEAGPVPKVIDFGIAKALHAPLTDRTLFTEFRQVMGTPEYMSPEQAETSSADVDTRSDVYALGVLLYELLTGTTPLNSETLRKADYGELQRLLRETEPPTPSRRLVTLNTPGEGAPCRPTARVVEIAKARACDPGTLGRQLRGELDWIVMKCLEKDRRRRYESASALAEDLRRHLANEPVLAGPPSTLYRLRKLAQRHRVAVAFAAMFVVAIGVALAGVTWGLMKVMAERDRAMAAHQVALRNNRESMALVDVLREFARLAPRGLDDSAYTVQQMLADLETDLAKHPEKEVRMRLVLGEVYQNAGRQRMFFEQVERAVQRAREVLKPTDALLANAVGLLAYTRAEQGRSAEAIPLAQEAIALHEQSSGSADLEWIVLVIAHGQRGQLQAMRRAADQAIESARANGGEGGVEHAFAVSTYALTLLGAGYVDEAIPLLGTAVELRARVTGERHYMVKTLQARLAVALALRGEVDRAEEIVGALEQQQLAAGKPLDPPLVTITAARVACERARGRFDAAIAVQRGLVASDVMHRRADDMQAAANRHDLADLLLQCGDADAAHAVIADDLAAVSVSPDSVSTRHLRQLAARCTAQRGDRGSAIREMEALLLALRQSADEDSVQLAAAREELAEVLLDEGAFARAAELAAAALRAREVRRFPRWRIDSIRALFALARVGAHQEDGKAEFALAWRALEHEPALPPRLRQRFAKVGK